ncbi:SDR family NAD(P)-dependent oxidoreductase [Sediminicurvatus halobius]|uniref:Oxidoreductase n=1 Tax=Sediminicurvatus halobius TaxID=2182432 RepID=A0A2U2MYN7_9GAMM|nr:SDR family oxidoreductase [Spiribacter halobius]PWG61824.1 oxidoreductase [Spiribacter halobius]UEX77665.1 SDR family oxidoreductase [Spiribacter halobius]
MRIDLTNHTALVTGSTHGIGFATAVGLANAGAQVIINGRHTESVDAALERLSHQAPPENLWGVAADLSTAEGCAALTARVPSADILVNNVGIFGPKDFFDVTDEDWQHFFELNVMSAVRLSRHYAPAMADTGWGRIVFVSSESGLNIPTEMIHYGFTKTAMLSVSRGLAKRMAGTGVTVNAVLPGPTLSEGVTAMLNEEIERTGRSAEEVSRDFVMEHRPSSIIQRAATPEEVANMIVYAVSEQASATTGAALRVDGGVVDSIA